VPSHGTPTGYTVTVTAQTATGGLVANATIALSEANGITLAIWVSSASSYADGSYQPGQTVTVNYEFTAVGQAVLAKTYSITMIPATGFGNGRDSVLIQTASSSGSFQYKIPSDAKNGVLLVESSARIGGPSCVSNCFTSTLFTIPINSSPAGLSYQIGAGSGLTVAWLILLILVILVAIGAIWLIRRSGHKTIVMKPESGGPSSGSGGTSPPPSGSS
jgi:hypothetical protein